MAQDVTIDIKFKLLEDINKKVDAMSKGFDQLNKKNFGGLTSSFSKISIGITGINQGLELAKKGFNLAKSAVIPFINEASKIEDLETQFVTLTGSIGNASALLVDLQEFAASTPFQLEGLADASKTLLSFGFGQDEVIGKLKQLGDVAAATGKDLGEITLIYGQVQAAGKLTGERLLQFQERAINLAPAIANIMGVAESSVRDLVSKGKVSFEIFSEAFKSLSAEGGQFAEGMIKQSKTLSGVLSTLTDNFKLLVADIGKDLLPIVKEYALRLIEIIKSNKDLIKIKVKEFFAGVSTVVGTLVKVVSGSIAFFRTLGLTFEAIANVSLRVASGFVSLAYWTAKVAENFGGSASTTESLRLKWVELNEAVEASNTVLKDNFNSIVETGIAGIKAGEQIESFGDKLKELPKEVKVNLDVAPKIEKKAISDVEVPVDLTGSTGTVAIDKKRDKEEQSLASKITTAVSGGRAGAQKIASDLARSTLKAFGPVGSGIAEAFSFLSQTPEEFKKSLDGFLDFFITLPNVLVENAAYFINKIVESTPLLVESFVESLPIIIDALLALLLDPNFWIRVGTAVVDSVLTVLTSRLFAAFNPFIYAITNFGDILSTVGDIFSTVGNIFGSAVDTLSKIADKIRSLASGGSAGSFVSGAINKVKDVFGFAEGGDVPKRAAFQNDGLLTRLSGGERVITEDSKNRLDEFLDRQENEGSNQPISITLQVGESQLAETIVNLGLKGYRLGVA